MAKIVVEPKPKRVKCDTCGATIEYLPEDIVVRSGSMFDYDWTTESVPCPRVTGKGKRCKGEGILRRV